MDNTQPQQRTKSEQYEDCKEMARLSENVNGKECGICYGLGQIGWNAKLDYYELCSCVTKAGEKVRKEKRNQPVPHEILPEENN